MPDGYEAAQICVEGHVITSMADTAPERRADFCPSCGKKTTTSCGKCEAAIRGYFHVEGVVSIGRKYNAPSFCHACGHAYSWTSAKLASASELADEPDGLGIEEQEKIKGTFDDLIRDTSRTELAAIRFKKLIAKASGVAVPAIRDVITSVATEAVKKSILG